MGRHGGKNEEEFLSSIYSDGGEQAAAMFSGLCNIGSGKRKCVQLGPKEAFFLSIFFDPELFIILRRTIQTDVIDIIRTKDFTFIETFQKVAVDGWANPAG